MIITVLKLEKNILHLPSASWAIDSEPIRARGIIVKYSLIHLQLLRASDAKLALVTSKMASPSAAEKQRNSTNNQTSSSRNTRRR